MKEQVIGIVGGMGSFATLDFFKRVLLAFPAEKEWERPRIIIDNRCTMPSRVRAILYNEKYDQLVSEMSESVAALINQGATDVILVCNTSHCFLKEIEEKVPESRGKIINIIDACCSEINGNNATEAYLMASEGTIATHIYEDTAEKYGITFKNPTEQELSEIRYFIEAIKQDNCDNEVIKRFYEFLLSRDSNSIVLGCTEMPIMYEKFANSEYGKKIDKIIFDPLQSAINELRRRSSLYEGN